jgi:hypothetical protein
VNRQQKISLMRQQNVQAGQAIFLRGVVIRAYPTGSESEPRPTVILQNASNGTAPYNHRIRTAQGLWDDLMEIAGYPDPAEETTEVGSPRRSDGAEMATGMTRHQKIALMRERNVQSGQSVLLRGVVIRAYPAGSESEPHPHIVLQSGASASADQDNLSRTAQGLWDDLMEIARKPSPFEEIVKFAQERGYTVTPEQLSG